MYLYITLLFILVLCCLKIKETFYDEKDYSKNNILFDNINLYIGPNIEKNKSFYLSKQRKKKLYSESPIYADKICFGDSKTEIINEKRDCIDYNDIKHIKDNMKHYDNRLCINNTCLSEEDIKPLSGQKGNVLFTKDVNINANIKANNVNTDVIKLRNKIHFKDLDNLGKEKGSGVFLDNHHLQILTGDRAVKLYDLNHRGYLSNKGLINYEKRSGRHSYGPRYHSYESVMKHVWPYYKYDYRYNNITEPTGVFKNGADLFLQMN